MTPGRVLCRRWEVGEVIGRGGMADVHVGRDIRSGRWVAIKVLRQNLADDPAFRSSFQREAQTTGRLRHRGIVALYDAGYDEVGEGSADRHGVHVSTAAVAVASVLSLAAAVPAADAASGGQRGDRDYAAAGLSARGHRHRTGEVRVHRLVDGRTAPSPSWRGACPAARTLRMNRRRGGRLLAATGDRDTPFTTPSAAAALAITSTAPVEVVAL